MSRTPITDALSDWVSDVVDRQSIFDNVSRMGPRPSRISCSMVLGHIPVGFGQTEITEVDGDPPIPDPDLLETHSVSGTLLVSMNLIGGDTLWDMQQLRASVGLSEYSDRFDAVGLGFARVGEFRDLSEIVKNEPEARHQADWEFNVVTSHAGDLFSIESATITNEGSGHSDIITET